MTDREFWLLIRRALLMIAAAIEKRWLCREQRHNRIRPAVANILLPTLTGIGEQSPTRLGLAFYISRNGGGNSRRRKKDEEQHRANLVCTGG